MDLSAASLLLDRLYRTAGAAIQLPTPIIFPAWAEEGTVLVHTGDLSIYYHQLQSSSGLLSNGADCWMRDSVLQRNRGVTHLGALSVTVTSNI